MSVGNRGGRPAKPTAQKKLEGTFRQDRASPSEWMPAPTGAEPPEYLTGVALAVWNRLAPLLLEAGLLTTADVETLARYCLAEATSREAQKDIDAVGLVVQTPFGPKVNPHVKIAREAREQASRIGAYFGLDPSARSRLRAPGKTSSDPVEEDLFGPGKKPRVIEGGKP